MAETGLLEQLDTVSSVSGGSIMSGLLARAWVDVGHAPTAAELRTGILEPLLAVTTHTLDIPSFLRGMVPRTSPGEHFAKRLDEHLLHGLTLGELPDRPAFVFNATNLGNGVLWRFSKGFVGDYLGGGTTMPEAACLDRRRGLVGVPAVLRAAAVARAPGGRPTSGDGGIYDNLGLETAWKRHATILVSDGGGTFRQQSTRDA